MQFLKLGYAFCALNAAERNYAHIEKESLVILFACDKLDYYVNVWERKGTCLAVIIR